MQSLEVREITDGVHWWELAGHFEPEALVNEWHQVHYAAQSIAEAGKSWSRERADDSHSALTWVPDTSRLPDQFFASEVTESSAPTRALLRPWDLKAFVIDASGSPAAEQDLEGLTTAEAVSWVRRTVEEHAGPPLQESRPAPDLPPHELARGSTFQEPNQLAIAEFIRLYSNTDAILERLAEVFDDSDEPRTWPHHFDHALLLTHSRDEGEPIRTIGVGLTPPDSLVDGPYWYVSPWAKHPAGTHVDDRPLDGGTWIERGASLPMAVLRLGEVSATEDPTEQQSRLAKFLTSAVNACIGVHDHGE